MAPKRNLHRGFWRLAFLVWAAGAAAILWWEDEPLLAPLAEVCRVEIEPAYPECFSEEAKALAESPALTERLLGRFREGFEGIDPSREVPRWTTARYREGLRSAAGRELAWAVVVWLPFYVLAWALAGFRADAER